MDNIKERLKKAMALRGISQAEIVEKTGINKGALSSYLAGRYVPKQNNIFLMAQVLSVDPAWLMGADVPMERTKSAEETLSEDDEIAQLMEQLHKNPELRILMSTSSKVTPESLRALINLAQNMKEKDD